MSMSHEIVPVSETISQAAQEGLGVGGQVIAKLEMRELGHSGETRQPGQGGLRVGQRTRMLGMRRKREVRRSLVDTSQPVVLRSPLTDSIFDMRVEELSNAARKMRYVPEKKSVEKLRSVSEKKSVEVKLFEASKDSEWFDGIEKKNCKLLLHLFRLNPSLWVQTGLKGRSVLHVALMQGCSELVHELHHNYKGDLLPSGVTPFLFLWDNARDGRLKDASAQDIWLVMEGPAKIGNESSADSHVPWWESLDGRNSFEYLHGVDKEMLKLREAAGDIANEKEFVMDESAKEMFELRKTIANIANEKQFVMDENDVDFNFVHPGRKELYMHMACNMLGNVPSPDGEKLGGSKIGQFIIAVIDKLLKKNLLQKLFEQHDPQGRTILQILVKLPNTYDNYSFLSEILQKLPNECVNTLDKAGRTVLYWAVGHNYIWAVHSLLNSRKVDCLTSFRTQYYWDVSILKLILLYEYELSEYKIAFSKIQKYDDKITFSKIQEYVDLIVNNQLNKQFIQVCFKMAPTQCPLDILSYAVLLGKKKFVEQIMETEEYKERYSHEKQLLSYAAYSGNVQTLQFFLQNTDVDNGNGFLKPFEAPLLHLAVEQTFTFFFWHFPTRKFNDYLHCNDFISIELLESKLQKKPLEEGTIANTYNINSRQYNGRQECVNLLLQAGADILTTNKDGCMANPGEYASNEAKTWWYELVANQTANIKKNLHTAGNGTAIVATLVATASFVGPLTPPLNYVAMSSGTTTIDVGVQVTKLLIKVFLMSNSLSFYLAITSIMLAIMPSLPIPKEGLVSGPCDDLKRNRRTISIAIGMLLASIISVLISFAASSLVVIPFQYRGLMAYSTSIGGIIWCMVFFFFFLRFLRLICPQNTFIRNFYQRFGKL